MQSLWRRVREHYRLGAKWGLDPIPPRYFAQAVMLMDGAVQSSLGAR